MYRRIAHRRSLVAALMVGVFALAACASADPLTPAVTTTFTPLPAQTAPAQVTDAPSTPAADREPDSPVATPEGREISSPLATPPNGAEAGDSPEAVLAALVDAAKAQLAETENVRVEELTLVSAEVMEWGDASLGCPEPDMAYAQVITSGYRITLAAGDEVYTVHTSMNPNGRIVHCEPQ